MQIKIVQIVQDKQEKGGQNWRSLKSGAGLADLYSQCPQKKLVESCGSESYCLWWLDWYMGQAWNL
jgi:hypothetical protein